MGAEARVLTDGAVKIKAWAGVPIESAGAGFGFS
jgi:hypothetical protein